MDKDITILTFSKVFQAFPYEEFLQIVINSKCDRYVKKSKTLKLLYLMVIAQLCGLKSLHAIADLVKNDKRVRELLHLNSISASTLSRRLRHIKHRVWEETFTALKTEIWKRAKNRNPGDSRYQLNIIDASTITLCLERFLWADFRKTKSGIKLHQRILVHNGDTYPDCAVLTTARRADKTIMDELIVLSENVLNVFDRGYIDYAKWDDYCQKKVRFVSRLKSNAMIRVLKEISTTKAEGLKERIVLLGKPNINQMVHPVRLIETQDQQGNQVVIVTNDLTLPATEIGDIYRLRWQIEIFFKWIKQHLIVKQFYGTSPNAVYGQIWIALIAYCLLQDVKQQLPKKHTLLEVLRAIRIFLYEAFNEMVAELSRGPTRTSRGRKTPVTDTIDELWKEINRRGTYALDAINEGMYL